MRPVVSSVEDTSSVGGSIHPMMSSVGLHPPPGVPLEDSIHPTASSMEVPRTPWCPPWGRFISVGRASKEEEKPMEVKVEDGQKEEEETARGEKRASRMEEGWGQPTVVGSRDGERRGNECRKDPKSPRKPHECEECGRLFNWRNHLTRHRRLHTGERPYKCSICGKGFNDGSPLLIHEMLHRGEKPYKCLDCGKSFSQSSHLISHQAVHTDEKPYVCPDCGKSFARQQYLLMHRRVHTGERPYGCRDCGKSFRKSSDLVRHRTVHTGEKPFKCPVCGKAFTQNFRCNAHKKVHGMEKVEQPPSPAQSAHRSSQENAVPPGDGGHQEEVARPGESRRGEAERCAVGLEKGGGRWGPEEDEAPRERAGAAPRPGERQEKLRPHEDLTEDSEEMVCAEERVPENQKTFDGRTDHQQLHGQEQPHKRPECGKSFAHGSDLPSHQQILPSETPEAPTGVAANPELLQRGPAKTTKSHLCSQCGKSFTRRFNLRLHQKLHSGERPYGCPECGLRFTNTSHLIVHQRIHTGERPYRCHACGKGFTMSSKCLEHERTHSGEAPYRCARCGSCYRTKVSWLTHLKVHLD
ncbi:uncharacterized protein J5M81_015454 [Pluvialis apricaria]